MARKSRKSDPRRTRELRNLSALRKADIGADYGTLEYAIADLQNNVRTGVSSLQNALGSLVHDVYLGVYRGYQSRGGTLPVDDYFQNDPLAHAQAVNQPVDFSIEAEAIRSLGGRPAVFSNALSGMRTVRDVQQWLGATMIPGILAGAGALAKKSASADLMDVFQEGFTSYLSNAWKYVPRPDGFEHDVPYMSFGIRRAFAGSKNYSRSEQAWSAFRGESVEAVAGSEEESSALTAPIFGTGGFQNRPVSLPQRQWGQYQDNRRYGASNMLEEYTFKSAVDDAGTVLTPEPAIGSPAWMAEIPAGKGILDFFGASKQYIYDMADAADAGDNFMLTLFDQVVAVGGRFTPAARKPGYAPDFIDRIAGKIGQALPSELGSRNAGIPLNLYSLTGRAFNQYGDLQPLFPRSSGRARQVRLFGEDFARFRAISSAEKDEETRDTLGLLRGAINQLDRNLTGGFATLPAERSIEMWDAETSGQWFVDHPFAPYDPVNDLFEGTGGSANIGTRLWEGNTDSRFARINRFYNPQERSFDYQGLNAFLSENPGIDQTIAYRHAADLMARGSPEFSENATRASYESAYQLALGNIISNVDPGAKFAAAGAKTGFRGASLKKFMSEDERLLSRQVYNAIYGRDGASSKRDFLQGGLANLEQRNANLAAQIRYIGDDPGFFRSSLAGMVDLYNENRAANVDLAYTPGREAEFAASYQQVAESHPDLAAQVSTLFPNRAEQYRKLKAVQEQQRRRALQVGAAELPADPEPEYPFSRRPVDPWNLSWDQWSQRNQNAGMGEYLNMLIRSSGAGKTIPLRSIESALAMRGRFAGNEQAQGLFDQVQGLLPPTSGRHAVTSRPGTPQAWHGFSGDPLNPYDSGFMPTGRRGRLSDPSDIGSTPLPARFADPAGGSLYPNLQPYSQVVQTGGNVTILGTGGSGKTHAQIEMMASANPDETMILSMTRASNENFSNRLPEGALGDEGYLGTFHRRGYAAIKALTAMGEGRNFGVPQYMNPGSSYIMPPLFHTQVVANQMVALNAADPRTYPIPNANSDTFVDQAVKYSEAIELAKTNLLDRGQFGSPEFNRFVSGQNLDPDMFTSLYDRVTAHLRSTGFVSVAETVSIPTSAVADNPDLKKVFGGVSHLAIDEINQLGPAFVQMAGQIIDANPSARVILSGDKMQSPMWKFLGGGQQSMEALIQKSGSNVVSINENYRLGQSTVDALGRLHNIPAAELPRPVARTPGEDVSGSNLIRSNTLGLNMQENLDRLAGNVEADLARGISPGGIRVIANSKNDVRSITDTLRARNLEYNGSPVALWNQPQQADYYAMGKRIEEGGNPQGMDIASQMFFAASVPPAGALAISTVHGSQSLEGQSIHFFGADASAYDRGNPEEKRSLFSTAITRVARGGQLSLYSSLDRGGQTKLVEEGFGPSGITNVQPTPTSNASIALGPVTPRARVNPNPAQTPNPPPPANNPSVNHQPPVNTPPPPITPPPANNPPPGAPPPPNTPPPNPPSTPPANNGGNGNWQQGPTGYAYYRPNGMSWEDMIRPNTGMANPMALWNKNSPRYSVQTYSNGETEVQNRSGQTLFTNDELGQLATKAQGMLAQASNPMTLNGMGTRDAVRSIQARLNDMMNDYVSEVAKNVKGRPEEGARMQRANMERLVMQDMTDSSIDELRIRNGMPKFESLRGQNRVFNARQLRAHMAADPALEAWASSTGQSPEDLVGGAASVYTNPNGTSYTIGGGSGSRTGSGGLFGSRSNYFNSPIGRAMFGLTMMRREWSMFMAGEAQSVRAYDTFAEAAKADVALGQGGLDLSGSDAGILTRREQGQRYMGRGSEQVYGGFLDAAYMLSGGDGSGARMSAYARGGLTMGAGIATAGALFGFATPALIAGGVIAGGAMALGGGYELYNQIAKPPEPASIGKTFQDAWLLTQNSSAQAQWYDAKKTALDNRYGVKSSVGDISDATTRQSYQAELGQINAASLLPENYLQYLSPQAKALSGYDPAYARVDRVTKMAATAENHGIKTEDAFEAIFLAERGIGRDLSQEETDALSSQAANTGLKWTELETEAAKYATNYGYRPGDPEYEKKRQEYLTRARTYAGSVKAGEQAGTNAQFGSQLQGYLGIGNSGLGSRLAAQFGIDNQVKSAQAMGWMQAAAYAGMQDSQGLTMMGGISQMVTPYASQNALKVLETVTNAGGSALNIGSVMATANLSNNQMGLLGSIASGDLRAMSYASYQTGDIAGHFFNQSGNPIWTTSGLDAVGMASFWGQTQWRGQLPADALKMSDAYQSVQTNLGRTGLSQASINRAASAAGLRAAGISDQGFIDAFLKGGTVEVQRQLAQKSADAQMAGAGIAMQQVRLQQQFYWGSGSWDNPAAGSYWNLEDRMVSLKDTSTRADMADSSKRMQMQNEYTVQREQNQFQRMTASKGYNAWQMNFNYGQQLQQRGWTRQDWQYQDQTRALNFGWKMEDLDEAIRYSSGRERRTLIRQRDRAAISENLESMQIDKTRDRQGELWKAEDERFDKQKEYQEELNRLDLDSYNANKKQREETYRLDRESWSRKKKEYEEQKAIEDEMRKLQRKFQADQLDLQLAALGSQAEQARLQKEWNRDIEKTGDLMSNVTGALGEINKYDNAFRTFMALRDLAATTGAVDTVAIYTLREMFDVMNRLSVEKINLLRELFRDIDQ